MKHRLSTGYKGLFRGIEVLSIYIIPHEDGELQKYVISIVLLFSRAFSKYIEIFGCVFEKK